jgi:hypothetical protein
LERWLTTLWQWKSEVLSKIKNHVCSLALMEAVSPDLEKQGFFAVVFVNREI